MEKFDIINTTLSGTNLIEASAGTGKTYALTGLYLKLIVEKEMEINQILAVTFTEAATEELRLRIRQRLREAYNSITKGIEPDNDGLLLDLYGKYKSDMRIVERLKLAIMHFDEASIFTIHAFCQKMLLENAFESSETFDTELLTDQSGIIRDIVDDFYRINFYDISPLLSQYVKLESINIEYFLELIKFRTIDPSFRIIPDAERPAASGLEKNLGKLYKKLQKAWLKDRDEIRDIFLNYEGISRQKYRIDSIETWVNSMDEFLSLDRPVCKFEKFIKFTATNLLSSMNKNFNPPEHDFFVLCDEFQNIHTELTSAYDELIKYLIKKLFDFIDKELRRRKNEMNLRSFDDLLENMHRALKDGPDSALALAVRKKYKAALIDEFQDTDPVQYNIFTTIFSAKDSVLFLIGDPKQAIYKFRGADIFAYFKAMRNVRSNYTLGTNWRSQPDYIAAINTIFSSGKNPFVFHEIGYNDTSPPENYTNGFLTVNGRQEPPLNIWFIDKKYTADPKNIINKSKAEELASVHTAFEIAALLDPKCDGKALINGRPVAPNNIAVLVRKNRHAAKVKDDLMKYNIPAVIYRSGSIFESHESLEIQRVIAAICEPRNENLLKAAAVTDIIGFNGSGLYQLLKDEEQWESLLTGFYEYHNMWLERGFIQMFRRLLIGFNVRKRLIRLPGGERRITNILHCAELLHGAEIEYSLGMEGLLKWLTEKRSNIEDSFEHQLRLETDEEAVNILTIHMSKGLEFPIIFSPFGWDESSVKSNKPFTFHDPADSSINLDIGTESEKNMKLSEKENLAENMRLLYVALTRGRHKCYLTWGKINASESSPHAHLFHNYGEASESDVSALKSKITSMSYDDMLQDMKNLEKKSGGTIRVSGLPEISDSLSSDYSAKNKPIVRRNFTGVIDQKWRVSSFSSIISGSHRTDESPDRDSAEIFADIETQGTRVLNGFTFPSGARAGTFIHEILESIDYTENNRDIINTIITEKIRKYGYGKEWINVIFDMVRNILNVTLSGTDSGFILGSIPRSDRLNEMEFYFPLKKITSRALADIFSGNENNKTSMDFAGHIEKLGFKLYGGYVKGFIDLVFRYKNRYYIVDWKSNHLGNDYAGYNPDAINSAMIENYYILQYHIYTAALNQYLKLKIPDYNYSKYFGGIYYIFLRGINPQNGNTTGIYHDIPSEKFINKLCGYLIDNKRRPQHEQ